MNVFFLRRSGLQHMIAEPFFCPFRVYWEVSFLIPICLTLVSVRVFIWAFSSPAEPNPDSPLNSYAARLWNNKEGQMDRTLESSSFIFFCCSFLRGSLFTPLDLFSSPSLMTFLLFIKKKKIEKRIDKCSTRHLIAHQSSLTWLHCFSVKDMMYNHFYLKRNIRPWLVFMN